MPSTVERAVSAWPREAAIAPYGIRNVGQHSCAVVPPWARKPTADNARTATSITHRRTNAPAKRLTLKWFCLIYQHNWNVVAHLVDEFARVADELVLVGPVLQLALALRAHQYLQESLVEHTSFWVFWVSRSRCDDGFAAFRPTPAGYRPSARGTRGTAATMPYCASQASLSPTDPDTRFARKKLRSSHVNLFQAHGSLRRRARAG